MQPEYAVETSKLPMHLKTTKKKDQTTICWSLTDLCDFKKPENLNDFIISSHSTSKSMTL